MHITSAHRNTRIPSSEPVRLFLVPPRVPVRLSMVPSPAYFAPVRPDTGKRMVLFAAVATPVALACLLLAEHAHRL